MEINYHTMGRAIPQCVLGMLCDSLYLQ